MPVSLSVSTSLLDVHVPVVVSVGDPGAVPEPRAFVREP
jgi:hypothetical protein